MKAEETTDMTKSDAEQRFALLREVYRMAIGNTRVGLGPPNMRECSRRASLSASDGEHVLEWLIERRLVDRREITQTIHISYAGVKEVEDCFTRPAHDTDSFVASILQDGTRNKR